MADAAHNALFSPFLSAAAQGLPSILPGRSRWKQLLAKYLRAVALDKADWHFGQHADAVDAVHRAEWDATKTYGKNWRANAETRASVAYAAGRQEAADDYWYSQFSVPVQEAALELMRYPAPDEAALLTKVEIIEREELYLYTADRDEPMKQVAADAARLSGGHA